MDSDRELLGRIASRDAEALGQLYDRHAARLHALALRMTCDTAIAAKVLEDSFLRVWNQPPDPAHDCGASLARITREVAREHSSQPAPASSGRSIPATPRELVEAAYFERRSVDDIARTCGLPEPEVRRLLRQGMDDLKRQFSPARNP